MRNRFLNVSLDAIIHPISLDVKNAALQQKVAADNASAVSPKELTSQEWLEKGKMEFGLGNFESGLRAYSEAIQLNPDFTEAYKHRAIVKTTMGDLSGALSDLQKSLQLNPTLTVSVSDKVKVTDNVKTSIVGSGNIIGSKNIVIDITPSKEVIKTFFTQINSKKTSVFLSHASQDKPIVREFYKRLITDGYDAWLDEEKLLPGQDWETEIENAINKTDVVMIFLSKNSITKDGYIQKELRSILYRARIQTRGNDFHNSCKAR